MWKFLANYSWDIANSLWEVYILNLIESGTPPTLNKFLGQKRLSLYWSTDSSLSFVSYLIVGL